MPILRPRIVVLVLITMSAAAILAQQPPQNEEAQVQQLRNLSLADLGNIPVPIDNGNPVGIRRVVFAGSTWTR